MRRFNMKPIVFFNKNFNNNFKSLYTISKLYTCIGQINNNNQTFSYQKDDCFNLKELTDMRKRNYEQEKFAKKLEKDGHTCIVYYESFPVQIGWCGEKICVNNKKK
jgi:hypothetical protein